MTTAACFRCDWEGLVDCDVCPRCGAPLVVDSPRAPRVAPAAKPDAPTTAAAPELLPADSEPPVPAASEPPALTRRGRRRIALITAFALAVGVLWWRDASRPAPGPAPLPLSGTLVYAAQTGAASPERLYVLDLASGRVSRGLDVADVTDLVGTSAEPGWLGAMAGGHAFTLRGARPDQVPVPLATGDPLSWGPAGSVVAVSRGPARTPRCPVSTITVTDVLYGRAHVLFEGPECFSMASVGSDDTGGVYVTLSDLTGSGVYSVEGGRFVSQLPGFRMLSVSPAGEMIVQPQTPSARFALGPFTGAALFHPGGAGPRPIARGDEGLVVERVLAWALDGSVAVVLGILGDVRSVWLVPTGRTPTPVQIGPRLGRSTAPADCDAAVAVDGTVFFSAGGDLFAWSHGRDSPIVLPPSAPPPAGPLAWLPSTGLGTSVVRHPPFWQEWTSQSPATAPS